MPIYQSPGSDNARLSFLERAKTTATQDIAAENEYITQNLVDEITVFLPDFEEKVNAVSEKLSGRAKEVRERMQAFEKMTVYTRDLWAVLKRRVWRMNEPAEVLTFYKLPLDGTVPNPNGQEEWLTIAKEVVGGDARAVAAGYLAMVNPSAEELDTVVQIAEAEYDDVAMADREYDKAQEELANLRPTADQLAQEVMDELRFTLRKKDNPSQRRIMRTYGATFKYAEGEPEEG